MPGGRLFPARFAAGIGKEYWRNVRIVRRSSRRAISTPTNTFLARTETGILIREPRLTRPATGEPRRLLIYPSKWEPRIRRPLLFPNTRISPKQWNFETVRVFFTIEIDKTSLSEDKKNWRKRCDDKEDTREFRGESRVDPGDSGSTSTDSS